MTSWAKRELALAVLVIFAAPAVPYGAFRLLGICCPFPLGQFPLLGRFRPCSSTPVSRLWWRGCRFSCGPGGAGGFGLGFWCWWLAWGYSSFGV